MTAVEGVQARYQGILILLLALCGLLLIASLGGFFEANTLADFESTSTDVPSEPEVSMPGLSPLSVIVILCFFGRTWRTGGKRR